jgi:hypothetical protein
MNFVNERFELGNRAFDAQALVVHGVLAAMYERKKRP